MDSPIRGRTRELTNKVEAAVPMNIHNRFDVEVIDAQTGKIKQRAQAENVICNQLWSYLLNSSASGYRRWSGYIHYGTGNGTPAVTDTSLFTFLGYGAVSTSDDVYSFDANTGVGSLRRKIQLSELTAVGSTITEVGIAQSSSSSTLCTHAMLKDANGNQISIAKANTDIINIYATIYIHISNTIRRYLHFTEKETMFQFAVGITGLVYSPYFFYGCNGSNYLPKTPAAVYASASKTATITIPRVASAEMNYYGIPRMTNLFCNSAWFPGSSRTGEPIGTGNGSTVDFATAFGFLKPGATIYVNGIATSATVDVGIPTSYINNLIGYLYPVDIAGCIDLRNFTNPQSVNANSTQIFYNPYYMTMGITHISSSYSSYVTAQCSNDLSTWVTVTMSDTSAYKNYKYWKIINTYTDAVALTITSSDLTGKNIHFSTPPTSGAVITADYSTDMIAKDSNYVFDLVLTYTFGEYTP